MIFLAFILLISILFVRHVVPEGLISPKENDVERKTIREFREMCPYTTLCSFNSSKTLPESEFGSAAPTSCCEPCSCLQCGTSCCPDKPDTYLSDAQVKRIKQDPDTCMSLQYKKIKGNHTLLQTGFYTLRFCPPGYADDDVQKRCLKDYQDFEFEEDLSHLVPVSNSNTIFKNKYCAICNGEDPASLHYWDAKVTCQIPATLPLVSSFIELKSALDNSELCHLIFEPGNKTYSENRCDFLIDRCNMTGLSQPYHPETERACLSYMSVYNKRYRNVHCYLCNKKPEDEVREMCTSNDFTYLPNTFVALLDFKGLAERFASAEKKHDRCPEYHVYDAVQVSNTGWFSNTGHTFTEARHGRATDSFRHRS